MTELALSVENVSHSFGRRMALDAVSLSVPSGTFTALLGLNGAGKTTLFSLVTRLYDNASGTIRVCGFDVRRETPQALSRLGIVFQSRTLDLELTVRQNMVYHATLHGIGFRAARERAAELLEQVALAERANDKVRQLSGGQMRRLEIARALLHRPRLLLLDEPTVGLDVEARQGLIDEVRRLVTEERLGVLWATHLIDEVAPRDRLAVIHGGRIRAEGQVSEVLQRTGAADVDEAFRKLVGQSGGAFGRREAAE